MKPIEPPDAFHLSAAVGWLMLGNPDEAEEELGNITPGLRLHPDVLEVRWQICAQEEKWKACVDIASAIIMLASDRPSAWIHHAYALRRVRSGGLQAAFDALYPAARKFPCEPLIPFNLSCYTCQMGLLEDACDWLRRAFAVATKTGAKKRLKHMALDEPDLEPLWRKIIQI